MKRTSLWYNPAAVDRTRELLSLSVKRDRIAHILSQEFKCHVTREQVSTWVSHHAREFVGQPSIARYIGNGPQKPIEVDPSKIDYRNNRLSTRFIRQRKQIPAELAQTNSTALLAAATKLRLRHPEIAADFRHQAALWAGSDTTFGAYDVEASNPLTAAYDAAPRVGFVDRPPTLVASISSIWG